MKKIIILTAFLFALYATSCHHDSLEDRAAKETKEYTERYCPTPFIHNQRTDSLTFNRETSTISFYYTLQGDIDNAEIIRKYHKKLIAEIESELRQDTKNKAYKDAGFKFHYVYRSEKTGKILIEKTLSGK